MEFCLMYYSPNQKLEISPLPKDVSILSLKTGGKELATALNYLGRRGWQIHDLINLKKTQIMQWTFKREIDGSLRENKTYEYCVVNHVLGEKLEMYPELLQDIGKLSKGNLLSKNADGSQLLAIMNKLSECGWIQKKQISVKKTKYIQYAFQHKVIHQTGF